MVLFAAQLSSYVAITAAFDTCSEDESKQQASKATGKRLRSKATGQEQVTETHVSRAGCLRQPHVETKVHPASPSVRVVTWQTQVSTY